MKIKTYKDNKKHECSICGEPILEDLKNHFRRTIEVRSDVFLILHEKCYIEKEKEIRSFIKENYSPKK